MSKKIRFRPDYVKLYPGVEISDEVLAVLKKSDIRMEYEEYHRKHKRHTKDKNGDIIELPSLEDSYERLLEKDVQFPDDSPSPEQLLIDAAELDELYNCLGLLDEKERKLIDALFFEGMTEREYASVLGITHQAVSQKRRKIILKIKKLWKF
ncbi:hypothetical protein FACS1894105_03770 [Clostridia bacterium]|nr:hypothetical protein FACS1894105_03770 [Clostridia bacterium]